MTQQTKDDIFNGVVHGVRLGTPGILALILWQLVQLGQKMDLLIQMIAAHK